MEWRRKGLFTL